MTQTKEMDLMKGIRPGPPTQAEAVVEVGAELKGLTNQSKWELKDLMYDRDLEDLTPEQAHMIKRWLVLNKLASRETIRFEGWMLGDDKFRQAVWKRRISRLEIHGLEVDAALASKAKKGDMRASMIYYQITGKMPVGNKMIDTPKDGLDSLSDDALSSREKELTAELQELNGEVGKRKKSS